MKPKTWQECPSEIFEKFLENINLDYDSYESSRVETVDSLLCNPSDISRTNKCRLERAWENLTDIDFSKMILYSIQDLEYRSAKLKYDAAFNKWIHCTDSELEQAKINLDLCRHKYFQS